jgi:hypothetical protein
MFGSASWFGGVHSASAEPIIPHLFRALGLSRPGSSRPDATAAPAEASRAIRAPRTLEKGRHGEAGGDPVGAECNFGSVHLPPPVSIRSLRLRRFAASE